MGHQINYYLTPRDVETIEQRLRQRTDFVIFLEESKSATPCAAGSLNVEDNVCRALHYCLARPEDMDAIVMRHVPEQGYWTFQVTPSPAIELGTCYFNGQILRRSRVYYVDGFYGPGGDWVVKSEEFRKWAKSVLAIVRKSVKPYLRTGSLTEYIGEDAAKWHAAGGKLVSM